MTVHPNIIGPLVNSALFLCVSVCVCVCVCLFGCLTQALYPAQVCGIMNESETVKRLRIAVHPDFSFKAGQW